MLNFRKEVALKRGDLCALKVESEEPFQTNWKKKRPRLNDYKLFFVLDTNFFGDDRIYRLIPITHRADSSSFYFSNKVQDSKWKSTAIIAVPESLKKVYHLDDVMLYVQQSNVTHRCNRLNEAFGLMNTENLIML